MPAFQFVGFPDEEVVQIYRSDHGSAHGIAAGQEIVERMRLNHFERIVKHLRSMDDAEDVFFDTARKVLHAVLNGKFTPDGSPSSFNRWFSTIVTNAVKDHFNRKKIEIQAVSIHASQDEDDLDDIFDRLDTGETGESERPIEDFFLTCHESEDIHYLAEISNSTAEEFEILCLIVIHGYKPREVASMTNIPVAEVSRIKWRVTNRIREALRDERNRRSW